MIGIDHLIYNDYVCTLLLNDLVIDFDDGHGVNSAAQQFRPIKISRLFHTCDGQCPQL